MRQRLIAKALFARIPSSRPTEQEIEGEGRDRLDQDEGGTTPTASMNKRRSASACATIRGSSLAETG